MGTTSPASAALPAGGISAASSPRSPAHRTRPPCHRPAGRTRPFTTEPAHRAAFGSLGRARNRLNLLHVRGVLDRFRHYAASGSESWRWTLGPVGAAIVAAARGEPFPAPPPSGTRRPVWRRHQR